MPQGGDQDALRAPSGTGFGRSRQLTRSAEGFVSGRASAATVVELGGPSKQAGLSLEPGAVWLAAVDGGRGRTRDQIDVPLTAGTWRHCSGGAASGERRATPADMDKEGTDDHRTPHADRSEYPGRRIWVLAVDASGTTWEWVDHPTVWTQVAEVTEVADADGEAGGGSHAALTAAAFAVAVGVVGQAMLERKSLSASGSFEHMSGEETLQAASDLSVRPVFSTRQPDMGGGASARRPIHCCG